MNITKQYLVPKFISLINILLSPNIEPVQTTSLASGHMPQSPLNPPCWVGISYSYRWWIHALVSATPVRVEEVIFFGERTVLCQHSRQARVIIFPDVVTRWTERHGLGVRPRRWWTPQIRLSTIEATNLNVIQNVIELLIWEKNSARGLRQSPWKG